MLLWSCFSLCILSWHYGKPLFASCLNLYVLIFPKGINNPLLQFMAELLSGYHGDGGGIGSAGQLGSIPAACLLLLSSQRIFNKVTVYRRHVFVLLSLCCILNPEAFTIICWNSQALQILPLLKELWTLGPVDIFFLMNFVYFWNLACNAEFNWGTVTRNEWN